jgi:hypothetical protein
MAENKGEILMTKEALGEFGRSLVQAMREPTEEEKVQAARRKKMRDDLIKEQMESVKARRQEQENCPHIRSTSDGRQHSTITAVHNYPDGIPRGICTMCQIIIERGDKHYEQVIISHQAAMQSSMQSA